MGNEINYDKGNQTVTPHSLPSCHKNVMASSRNNHLTLLLIFNKKTFPYLCNTTYSQCKSYLIICVLLRVTHFEIGMCILDCLYSVKLRLLSLYCSLCSQITFTSRNLFQRYIVGFDRGRSHLYDLILEI